MRQLQLMAFHPRKSTEIHTCLHIRIRHKYTHAHIWRIESKFYPQFLCWKLTLIMLSIRWMISEAKNSGSLIFLYHTLPWHYKLSWIIKLEWYRTPQVINYFFFFAIFYQNAFLINVLFSNIGFLFIIKIYVLLIQ